MHKDLFHNGTKLVSVTSLQAQISKPFLDAWKKGMCDVPNGLCGIDCADQIKEEAADFSNVIHAEIAQYLNDGVLMEQSDKWTKRIVSLMREGDVKKYLVEPEETLRCNEANLSGSPDLVGKGWGKTFIGDHKIKKSMDLATGAQGYGYRLLIKKLYGEDIRWMAVFFGNKKTDKLELKWIDLDEWGAYFKALVTVWNKHNKSRQINLRRLR